MELKEILSKRCVEISDMSVLSVDDELINNIDYVIVPVYVGTSKPRKLPYIIAREDFIKCKSIIDEIIQKVKRDSNNCYEMFASIYDLLSQYFETDATEDLREAVEKKDIESASRIQGVYGLLVENRGTCSSVAFTLFNICKSVGIDCVMINGKSREEDGDDHSWNMVNLDGKWYNADLKWDMEQLKEGQFPLKEFLKSSKDFAHSNLFDYYLKDYEVTYCTESFPEDRQIQLFSKPTTDKKFK